MSQVIDRILSLPEFAEEPPVLVEVGASGGTHRAWTSLARYSIGIVFDPDNREMQTVYQETRGYRRLHVFPAAAVADDRQETDFFLTRSPYCSSSLPPNAAALAHWSFARLFDVESVSRVPCMSLSKALEESGVSRVDWFKTDSQGTDLRLFQSLGNAVIQRVMAVEFEPGILDAYLGEDKLSQVLAAMDRSEFWLSDLRIRGTLRMTPEDAQRLGRGNSELSDALPISPGWGEMVYLNTFCSEAPFSKRDWLLGWVIGTVNGQHGFALDLARRGHAEVRDPIFAELMGASEHVIRQKIRRGWASRGVRSQAQRLRSLVGRVFRASKRRG